MLAWKPHRDDVSDARLDFFRDVFLDEELDSSPIVVEEY